MRLSEALRSARAVRFDSQKSGEGSIRMAERCLRFLGDRPAKRVKDADLRRMVLAMLATGLSPASCNRHLSALSVVLEQAGHVLPMPWQKEPKGRTRWPSRAEIGQLAQACLPMKHGEAVSSLVLFLAETGCRVGEVLAMRWEDLELEGAHPHALIRTSKNNEPRRIPLTQEAVRVSRTRLAQTKGPWALLSQSVSVHVFRRARDLVATTRGEREICLHSLRHARASSLVEAGVSLPIVSAMLGHKDAKSTLRYVHCTQAGLEEALRIAERYVARTEAGSFAPPERPAHAPLAGPTNRRPIEEHGPLGTDQVPLRPDAGGL